MRRLRRLSRWAANQKPQASKKSVPTARANIIVPAALYAAAGIRPLAPWAAVSLEPGSVASHRATEPREVAVRSSGVPGRAVVRYVTCHVRASSRCRLVYV